MQIVHAPYGFVPLNEQVFLPEWAPAASQDWPFEDGLCGTLSIDIEAHTPIFTRDPKDPKRFFRGPDDQPALPGSGLRGAIRALVEIASFGWMRRVNDHRYGVRDLQHRNIYGRHMSDTMEALIGRSLPLPKVMAGWLQRSGAGPDEGEDPSEKVATITPCHFAKMEYRDLMDYARRAGVHGYKPGERQSAVRKYRTWNVEAADDPKLAIEVEVEDLRPHDAVPLPFRFGRIVGPGSIPGTLVFTGQPSRWTPDMAPRRGGGHPKHHDFVFYGEDSRSEIAVSRRMFAGFDFVHGSGQEQHSRNQRRSRNEEWAFWGRVFDDGGRVPVFFLLTPDSDSRHRTLRAFGLAMMFRLAYDQTTVDAVRSAQPHLGFDPRPDFAETLFGHVPLARRRRGADREALLKGRVSFGLGRVLEGGKALAPRPEVLGAPKASFYPSYVEQVPGVPGAEPIGGKDHYRTFMDADARIRGHKRYRPQPEPIKGPPAPTRADGSVNEAVATTFAPLEAGTVFRSTLRVHNVRRAELGALLWALDFGEAEGCFHTLGMARSHGYGRCTLRVASHDLRDNAQGKPMVQADLEAARAAFVQVMEAFCAAQGIEGGWAGSRRIFELLELARVLPVGSPHRRHMLINASDPFEPSRKLNEFVAAKKDGAALPPAGDDEAWVAHARALGREVHRPQRVRGGSAGSGGSGPSRTPSRVGGPGRAGPRFPERTAPVRPAAAAAGAWSPIRGGTEVDVEIVGQNKKGRWQVKLTGPEAQGFEVTATVGLGDPPAGAEVGMKCKVVVQAGGNRLNLVLRWG